jgi:hypothetical protein
MNIYGEGSDIESGRIKYLKNVPSMTASTNFLLVNGNDEDF